MCLTDNDEQDVGPDDLAWAPFGYLRLRKAAYSDAELTVWAERITAARAAGRDVHCFFRHEDEAAGPRMAIRLRNLMEA